MGKSFYLGSLLFFLVKKEKKLIFGKKKTNKVGLKIPDSNYQGNYFAFCFRRVIGAAGNSHELIFMDTDTHDLVDFSDDKWTIAICE